MAAVDADRHHTPVLCNAGDGSISRQRKASAAGRAIIINLQAHRKGMSAQPADYEPSGDP